MDMRNEEDVDKYLEVIFRYEARFGRDNPVYVNGMPQGQQTEDAVMALCERCLKEGKPASAFIPRPVIPPDAIYE